MPLEPARRRLHVTLAVHFRGCLRRLCRRLNAPPVVKEPLAEIPGTLFVVGGGAFPDQARAEFVKLAGVARHREVGRDP